MKCDKDRLDADFGLELECLRITEDGFLSERKYSFDDERISKDFAESQMEFITDIYGSIHRLYRELVSIYKKADAIIGKPHEGKREYIWPFSVPPYVKPGAEIEIAQFGGADNHREVYRRFLADKYGRKKMLYCGIHFNFSFSERGILQMYEKSGSKDFRVFKSEKYLGLAAKIAQYAWMPVLLMGASPVFDISFTSDTQYGTTVFENEAARRCGINGYWNDFEPVFDYSDFEAYIASIRKMIDKGLLYSESELYYPVRLKCHNDYTLDNLHKNGADYVEYRLIDINPLCPYGVKEEDLIFLHMFFVYLDSRDDICDMSGDKQKECRKKIYAAAMYDNEPLWAEAKALLYEMKQYFSGVVSDRYMQALDSQIEKMENEDKMYARIIRKKYGEGYVPKGVETAKKYSDIYEDNIEANDTV